jgi:autotransporter-associated beta strand protein
MSTAVKERFVYSAAVKPKHLKKTRLAASLATVMMGFAAAPGASAQVPVVPPPIFSYPGDPGTAGNPASWRTTEFLRDWGLRAISAEFAYAAGFAGAGTNVGVIDSGYFLGWTTEHAGPSGDRWISVTASGGTTGPTPGFYNQTYNDTHGTHVSGTVAAARDLSVTPTAPANPAGQMHGVSFDAMVSFGNTHKTDSVYYGLQPANVTDVLTLDNGYLENVYQAVAASVTPAGAPVRIIHSSWGSQPSTENYNTYYPPANGPASFGLDAAWQYLSTPDGVPDANGHLNHWLNGAIAVARTLGTVISFSAGNGGYVNTTPRGSASYFLPDLEGHWVTETGISQTNQTFNADGSILVPGTEQFNQCGVAYWACVAAPSNSINSTIVQVVNGTPTANYGSESGTSMAGPHGASTLNLIMMRFPYMTNDQALYTMFTTGRQNATISSSTGSAIANPTKGQIVSVPDMRNGWGTVNLRDAFGGPGQLFGRFTLNTHGFSDVWSHNISDVAIQARQQVDAAEAVTWQATVVGNGWQNGVPPNATAQQVSDFTIGTARANARSTRIYTGQLVKQGDGTLFMTGANTYTGSNTLSGGKLSITGSMLAPITVAGGTLGGTGTIAGSISMLSGMIWPGLSATEAAFINDGVTVAGDVLNVATAKMGAGGAFVTTIRSATDYTQLQATGVVALGATLMIDLEGVPAPGSVLTIVSSGSPILGTFKGLPEGSVLLSGGQTFTISYLNNKVTLTAHGSQT